MNYTTEQLREKLHTLPEDVQNAIFSVETAHIIAGIKEKYRLHIDQTGTLAEEIGLVMLGITRPQDFVNTIATKLRITQVVASQITQDINAQIFNPIKESLKQIHESHGNAPHEVVKTKPSDTDTVFDTKLKGLFISTGNTTNTSTSPQTSDPYREAVE